MLVRHIRVESDQASDPRSRFADGIDKMTDYFGISAQGQSLSLKGCTKMKLIDNMQPLVVAR